MPEPIRTILATDCGSTTTKAILIEKQGDGYQLITRGEAPTTVEAPIDDVTVGVTNAVREVEELSGKRLLADGKVLTERRDDRTGTDLYLSTSSAAKLAPIPRHARIRPRQVSRVNGTGAVMT